ncbi:DUF6583 family protein [Sporosarcina sp. FSL K6-2383]|uniref:DUF6583 family protein n=1 Tax=Sporosarcina sp. FSL K6-2383 TaxID=2921556 RepID=UPI00315B0743
MEETVVKKKSFKTLIVLIVTALVVVGGSASAFFLLNKSAKVQYFLAEVETYKQMNALAEERYKNEVNWVKVQQEKPVETKFDLSGEWNDPSVDYAMQEIQSIVNSVTLSMNQVYDPTNKEIEVALSGELGNLSVDFGTIFATTEKLVAEFPFMEELIRFDDKDFGKTMREFDENFEGNENLGLPQLFESSSSSMEEVNEYIEKEYIEFFIKELPEDAFTTDKEEILVADQKLKAKKITMDLKEEQVKTLLKDLLAKAKTDEKLKEIVKNQLGVSAFAGDLSASDLAMVVEEFDKGIDAAIEGVDTLHIPNGLQSTIWHQANHIVKRDFALAIGSNEVDVVTVNVTGTQLLEKTAQQLDYKLAFTDSFGDENAVNIKGNLSWKDQKADDSIAISVEDLKFTYQGKEELIDNKRTFTRTFKFTDGYSEPALIWKGSATHDSDAMTANHEFTISEQGLGGDMFNLLLKQQGKVVKKVDMPEETADTVNIGQMNREQIESFIELEVAPRVEDWFYDLMGDVEGELY